MDQSVLDKVIERVREKKYVHKGKKKTRDRRISRERAGGERALAVMCTIKTTINKHKTDTYFAPFSGVCERGGGILLNEGTRGGR